MRRFDGLEAPSLSTGSGVFPIICSSAVPASD